MAFARESGYRDASDCSARNQSVCGSRVMSWQRYASSEYESTASAPNGYVTRGGSEERESIVRMASRKVVLGNVKAACVTTVIGDCVREFGSVHTSQDQRWWRQFGESSQCLRKPERPADLGTVFETASLSYP